MTRRATFEMGDLRITPGRAATRELPVPSLVTGTHVSLPVRVTHGREPGPTIWISAALPTIAPTCPRSGATSQHALVHQGDALVHVAAVRSAEGHDLSTPDTDDRDDGP